MRERNRNIKAAKSKQVFHMQVLSAKISVICGKLKYRWLNKHEYHVNLPSQTDGRKNQS
jgi:hypothetical protein